MTGPAKLSLETLLKTLELRTGAGPRVEVKKCRACGGAPEVLSSEIGRLYYYALCKPCSALERQARVKERLAKTLERIPAHHRAFSLDDPELPALVTRPQILPRVRRLLARLPLAMVFQGASTGIGKTATASAVLVSILRAASVSTVPAEHDRAAGVVWVSAMDLGSARRESALGRRPAELERARLASVLLIDELGREEDVDAIWTVLYERRIHERPTLFTTPLDAAGLRARYDEGGSRRCLEPPHAVVFNLEIGT